MDPIIAFIKDFLIPGSVWFLLLFCSISAVLIAFRRTRTIGRRLLAGVVALHWLMSMPIVAYGLQIAQRVRRGPAAPMVSLPPDALPIIVLGNGLGGYVAAGGRFEVPLGRTAMNTLFAVERYRRSPGAIVIASGGPQPGADNGTPEAVVIRDGLVRNGIPADRIVLESRSMNTHEQAIEVSKILMARGQNLCVLVTSPQQMPRAIELFRREGITTLPLLAGSQMWDPSETGHWWSWIVPTAQARVVSRDVFYELAAWPYYWMHGWVG
jgi:uncharacterized SAM-binding protein YcdF (DUF218 family)